MSDPINRKSPLYRVLGKGATGLSERAFEGHLILRGDSADAAFGAAVHATTGVVLPLTPNTVASAAGPHWCSACGWNGRSTSGPRAAAASRLADASAPRAWLAASRAAGADAQPMSASAIRATPAGPARLD